MSEDRAPDIEFRASVRARRLRFDEEPDVRIEATRSGSRRTNLPNEVRAHVTYEDVQVDAAILSWIDTPDEPT
ncbi:hypothetical protein PHK61_22390 [Actinomycetospora lutea]|uniref:hypothetical protein n=1 Tax=Actinomycetospora lutea TaxID=663604 RepID=UPI002366BBD0|nr:hypothetical protein [Actinomycetospora lutea]MDD7941171.1 hypothetical protein [Actinomycetospora lutea]